MESVFSYLKTQYGLTGNNVSRLVRQKNLENNPVSDLANIERSLFIESRKKHLHSYVDAF
jgi:hypothetical protein